MAIRGIVHEPVKINPPVKVATGPLVVVTKAEMMFVTVDTAGWLTDKAADNVDGGAVIIDPDEVDDNGEHPRKSGMLML